ncbi:hypothetical protein K439DRAFT_1413077 [Ramaria rubella]|nr:hypothetical protein K439DRAFT_1413077 [Ramaria rubella]
MASHNAARGDSNPPYSRKRSSTVSSTSVFKNNVSSQPLQVGDTTTLSTWVSDTPAVPVALNHECWPGVAEGDMIEVTTQTQGDRPGFLFIVRNDAGLTRQTQQQITIAKTIADNFGFINHREVILTKVDRLQHLADYIEITFQDQYLGRSDMWRIGQTLQDQCVYSGQEIQFLGSVAGIIRNIYIRGAKVASAQVTPATKTIYRTLSAKTTIFIQVCRELWDFAGDGERYYEKIVHSFLPALFSRWSDTGAKHIVTIVLISRVHYDQTEVEYAAGPLRRDDDGRWYKDFYKVITDLETIQDWRPTLVSLKDSFFAFQRDILLTHHYHRAFHVATTIPSPAPMPYSVVSAEVRLVGTLSYAHDGPILEAINLTLNPSETHYIDRSLSLTGTSTILITPGTGYFVVPKRLLRSTTLRLLDQGFGLDLVSLAKKPLHRTPIFSFKGELPELRSHNPDKEGRIGSNGSRELDPLWGGGDGESLHKTQFWWEPFWISTTFWDQQMDLPFRVDRFVARAKMHEIQMLGLLEHDLLSSIEIPYLDAGPPILPTSSESALDPRNARRMDADNFDLDTFALRKNDPLNATDTRNSIGASSGSAGTIVPSHLVSSAIGRERIPISLSSSASSKFPPIAEDQGQETPVPSPPRARVPLISSTPLSTAKALEPTIVPILSSSPSRASVLSSQSANSSSSSKKARGIQSQVSLASKFAPGWLFNPFRTSSQPQTSVISVTSTMSSLPRFTEPPPKPSTSPLPTSRPPKPVSISNRRTQGRNLDDSGLFGSNRSSFPRTSPLSSSPRDRDGTDALLAVRRSTLSSLTLPPVASSPPRPSTNPSRPVASVSYEQASLARRWQHIYPTPSFEHQIKWKSVLTPGCLPLTVEHFPTQQELDTAFEYFSYDFVVDPPSMSSSFCIKVPGDWKNLHPQESKDIFALAVMRGQTALRLAQGFQIILRTRGGANTRPTEERNFSRRSRSFAADEEIVSKPIGVSEVLQTPFLPIYLSMPNEIHRLSYNGEVIKVELHVRRVGSMTRPFDYECLVWPKLGDGYTEVSTSFRPPGVEKLGWNSMDMVVAGYEQHFSPSSRFWRTRFIVIPTEEPPPVMYAPSQERLNDEEVRLAGMDKLAELFGKARWVTPGEKADFYPAPRFLPTYLGPAASVSDDAVVTQLEEIHASGPLKKKKNSDKVFQEYSMVAIAKAMRDEEGIPIKDHKWHGIVYPESFTGFELTSWLVREFNDISTRDQAMDAGSKLHAQGLFEHCRKHHGFLDGHYFYRFKGEFSVPRTPRGTLWGFRGRHGQPEERTLNVAPSGSPIAGKGSNLMSRKYKKRLVLSQTMVIDADTNKKSQYAETAILHHDVIHNPMTAFHFELNWISTSARCLEELIRQWSRTIERYGLRLVEGYVDQITDIRDKNTFQSCFPIRLAIPPPMAKRSPDNIQIFDCYFESMLLKKFGFILDVEAQSRYSDQVDVFYSYRRSSYRYTQFVHRSGAAFVQVMGGQEGFRFLTNRLLSPGRLGSARDIKGKSPSQVADQIRDALHAFCSDPAILTIFYEESMSAMQEDDVEPLAI